MTELREPPGTPVEKHGKSGAVVVASLTFIFAALLIFPGFMAAWLSKTGELYLLRRNVPPPAWVILRIDVMTPVVNAALQPAQQLMNHSERIRNFYLWQYRLAGGEMSH